MHIYTPAFVAVYLFVRIFRREDSIWYVVVEYSSHTFCSVFAVLLSQSYTHRMITRGEVCAAFTRFNKQVVLMAWLNLIEFKVSIIYRVAMFMST
jgi:hypothetical protein